MNSSLPQLSYIIKNKNILYNCYMKSCHGLLEKILNCDILTDWYKCNHCGTYNEISTTDILYNIFYLYHDRDKEYCISISHEMGEMYLYDISSSLWARSDKGNIRFIENIIINNDNPLMRIPYIYDKTMKEIIEKLKGYLIYI